MGTFSVTIEVGDPTGTRFQDVEALVDTDATTTVIPSSVLAEIGIVATRQEEFQYADGRRVLMDMAETKVKVQGKDTTTWVIFGEEDGGALLGSYTLEGVLLGVDPYNQRLIAVSGILK